MILAIYTFFLVWSLGGLSWLHTQLACANLTTNQHLKTAGPNPFNQGLFRNLAHFYCGPLPVSWINRRGYAPSPAEPGTAPDQENSRGFDEDPLV